MDHRELFVQWVEDLLIQGHINEETYKDIIMAVDRGDYDEMLSREGGVYL